MAVHEVAARGFDSSAGAYERARPGYPAAAVDALVGALGVGAGATVVDLGAGTGKLTRLLVPTGARLVAVEPLAGMRAELSRAMPEIDVVGGTAEAIPLAGRTADAVVAAQAFHWFSGAEALSEIHRVLRPGGGLGLMWNRWDRSAPWLAGLADILDAHAGSVPRFRSGRWRLAFEATGLFGPLEERRFPNARELDAGSVVDWISTTSFVAVLPEPDRSEVLGRVEALVADQPQPVTVPYETHVYTCRARP